ncbi:hypothetical protein [Nonomuraea cavernae]|nr:hypothetical protein [Nonomuraea cavernae]
MSEEDRLAWARGFAEELRDERDGTPDDTSPSSGRDDSKDGP